MQPTIKLAYAIKHATNAITPKNATIANKPETPTNPKCNPCCKAKRAGGNTQNLRIWYSEISAEETSTRKQGPCMRCFTFVIRFDTCFCFLIGDL